MKKSILRTIGRSIRNGNNPDGDYFPINSPYWLKKQNEVGLGESTYDYLVGEAWFRSFFVSQRCCFDSCESWMKEVSGEGPMLEAYSLTVHDPISTWIRTGDRGRMRRPPRMEDLVRTFPHSLATTQKIRVFPEYPCLGSFLESLLIPGIKLSGVGWDKRKE